MALSTGQPELPPTYLPSLYVQGHGTVLPLLPLPCFNPFPLKILRAVTAELKWVADSKRSNVFGEKKIQRDVFLSDFQVGSEEGRGKL